MMDAHANGTNGGHENGRPRMADFLKLPNKLMRWCKGLFLAWIVLAITSWFMMNWIVGETNVGMLLWELDHVLLLLPSIALFVVSKVLAWRAEDRYLQRVRDLCFQDGPLRRREFAELIGGDPGSLTKYGFDTEKLEFDFADFRQAHERIRKQGEFSKKDIKG
ncbi:MAG: hypothetical protein ACOC0E_06030 [Spirochaetota bacterium]